VTSTLDFLKRILPDEGQGFYCAWELERKRNFFFRSAESLADFILSEDVSERTIYHAVNCFTMATRRNGENSSYSRSFYLDLDAGAGKPYADQQASLVALRTFCSELALPPPTLVNSGHGVHVYWPLEHAIDPATWRHYSTGLKALCRTHNLHADSARTSDIASILRTPGTHNRKNGSALPVIAGPLTGPYQLEQFEVFKNAARSIDVPKNRTVGRPAGLLATAIGDMYGDQQSDGNVIADACAQLGSMRETLGRMPEPLWHACLGVLGHCGDDQLAHEWSTGDERYNPLETQAKLDRWKTLGPATCSLFEEKNPAGCKDCPFKGKITSPIQLGRDRQEIPQPILSGSNGSELIVDDEHSGFSNLPKGFLLKKGALVFQTAKDDRTVDLVVVKHELQLVNVQFGEMGGDHAYVFRQQLPKEETKEFSIAANTFLSAGGRGEMANKGSNILEWNHFVKYVMGAVDIFREQSRSMIRYEQFGWKDNDTAFLYGLNLYTTNGKTAVLTTADLQTRCEHRGIGPNKKGSLEGWMKAASQLFGPGMEAQSISLLSSFAAPLIRFQEADEGGAVLHLLSGSAGGKTTALIGAASVWGKFDAFRIKKDDTAVGRMLILSHLSNLPVIYDEILTKDTEVAHDFIISFTNGADRTRATRAGEIKHNESRWQTILLTAGNTSLREALGTGDKPDTQAHRVMELPCSLPKHIAAYYNDQIKADLRRHSGYAGDVYITYVVNNAESIREMLKSITDLVRKETKLPQEYRFWVRTIGAIVTAAMIVKHLNLIEFSPNRIYGWLKQYVIEHRSGPIHNMSEVENLAKFYNEHVNNCLPVAGPVIGGKQLNMDIRPIGRLYMRREQNTSRLYVAIGPMRDWCIKNGIHFKGLVDKLFEDRIVRNKNKFVTLGAGTPLSAGQTRCLEVDLSHAEMAAAIPEPLPENNPLDQNAG
jgi:Domain of unknown function (DUF927)